jgi:Domain of Unknown Function (DUF1080)
MKTLLLLLLALPLSLPAAELNTLTPEEKASGWQLFFNGRDLADFRIFGSDARPGAGWKIEQGILKKLPGVEGGNIVTKRTYKDFTLIWEWRISEKGNSGIKYLVDEARPSAPGPEFQMLDDIGHPDGKKGSNRQTGALYDIIPPSSDKLLKPVGEWNRARITVKGNHVEHWINGSPVLTYELGSPELMAAIAKSKFAKAQGYGKKMDGRIMLTDHEDGCEFRNMKILTTPAQ